jgi:cytochrome c peroxidase
LPRLRRGSRPWRSGRTGLASIAIGLVLALQAHAATAPPAFTAAEREAILRHGPWPPPPAADPGNAQSGRPSARALGQRLFFDARLSPSGRVACASCHVPGLAFTDARRRSSGLAALDRNAPTLFDSVYQRWQGWDGAADSLWSQAIRPLLDAREMGSSADHVHGVLVADAELSCRYRSAFGRAPQDAAAQAVLVDAAKAIGAFVATLISPRTPFDDFRDALARGDDRALASYPAAAQRGARIFVGKGNCALCHAGPRFSNGEFGDIGLPFFSRPGVVDAGRYAGIEALRASPYNRLSRWADAAEATPTRHVALQPRNFGEFKVPGLRLAAQTAPYMHDGQLATLADVVRHYAEIDEERLHADGERILKPLRLSDEEQAELVAFLRTLSPPAAAPWEPLHVGPCR